MTAHDRRSEPTLVILLVTRILALFGAYVVCCLALGPRIGRWIDSHISAQRATPPPPPSLQPPRQLVHDVEAALRDMANTPTVDLGEQTIKTMFDGIVTNPHIAVEPERKQ